MTSTVSCFRCENELPESDAHQVEHQIYRNYTREEAESYVNTYYARYDEEYRQRLAADMLLRNGRWENIDVIVCGDCISYCEWCSDDYLEAVKSDCTYVSSSIVEGVHVSTPMEDSRMLGYVKWAYDDRICRSCSESSFTCDRCDNFFHIDDCHTVNHDYSWCGDCWENYSEYCDHCDMNFDQRHRCESGGGRIHNYSYKPAPDFRWIVEVDGDLDSDYQKRATAPYLGFELELELNDADMDDALDIVEERGSGLLYCKHDGSLDDGFEIVSHPMTLAAQKQILDWSMLDSLKDIGCRSWNTSTCGLHVHINRRAFVSNRHIAMFQHLIINNEAEMSRLAGRSGSQWARFENIRPDIQKRLKGLRYADRYEAVNTLPTNTLEVRMFRGSLKIERVHMALELVDAAWRYTRSMSSRDYRNTDRAHFWFFARWCESQPEYANLNHFIQHYNLTENIPSSLVEVDTEKI